MQGFAQASGLLPVDVQALAAAGWPSGAMLAAVGLSAAWMLAWGFAALIPIALHFLNRRRQQPIPWAAMQLLLQVIEQQARRARVEQLLLLALRVLILLLLALALASPFWNAGDNGPEIAAARAPQLWILVLDTSYSMGYRSQSGTRIEAAKARATELIAAAEPGDAFALVELSQPSKAVLGSPTFDRTACLSELQTMSLKDTGSELGSCLAIVSEIAKATSNAEGMPRLAHIVFLSDLGQDCWQAAVDGPQRTVLQQMQKNYLTEIESFSDADPANTAIVAMRPSTSRAVSGESLLVEIDVATTGAAAQRLPVQLELDGRTVASTYVDIPAGESRSVRLEAAPQVRGSSLLAASIPDDRLMADNRRLHVIEVRQQYRVLLVEYERNDARLIRLALQAANRSTNRQVINSVSQVDLPTIDLNQWDLVILNDIPWLGKPVLDKLQGYARDSGSLVCLFGPRTDAAVWNTYAETNPSLLGFRFSTPSVEAEWSIDPLDYRSPVVAPFAGFPNSGLLTTPIFRLWQIEIQEDQRPLVDLATTDGKPLIVRQRLGTGWVASLLSAPQDGLNRQAEQGWNAIATWPSFLPLMQQLVQVALNTGADRHNLLAGDPLQGRLRDAGLASTVTIQRPDGSESQLATEAVEDGAMLSWIYYPTQSRGGYRASWNGGEQAFAVNLSPVESNLQSVPVQQLPRSQPNAELLDRSRAVAPRVVQDESLARAVLGLLMLLLVLESCLAWWLGRRIG